MCLVAQSRPTLCDPMDCSLPGSSIHGGFSRQEYWSKLPCPPSGDLPHPGIESRSPALLADSSLSEPAGKPTGFLKYYPWVSGHPESQCCRHSPPTQGPLLPGVWLQWVPRAHVDPSIRPRSNSPRRHVSHVSRLGGQSPAPGFIQSKG